tara:strand:+ start:13680 stop:13856 length:177 start_codon:yes stop_codon:yes gene_type:complete
MIDQPRAVSISEWTKTGPKVIPLQLDIYQNMNLRHRRTGGDDGPEAAPKSPRGLPLEV